MIAEVVLVIGLVHVLVFINLIYRFGKLETLTVSDQPTFTILIPTRNEEYTLPRLLDSINKINYPSQKFEVIVIDDSSEDETLKKAENFKANFDLRILRLPLHEKGKKAAIELGVSLAKNEIILTTDADCQVPSSWLETFGNAFRKDVKMVVGPVRMDYSNMLGALQSFDFSILIGYAASLVGMGIPSMSNGANLAYRREVFSQVEGYKGNAQIPSGDDEFLLLKVAKKYPSGIQFLKKTGAVVSTGSKARFSDLLNQRVRWLSKWALHRNPKIMFSVLAILIDNLAMMVTIIGLIFGFLPTWVGLILLARLVVKGVFSCQANRVLEGKTSWPAVVLYELIYPFYVLVLSFASIFGYYTWKGRKYSK